jgi:peptidyl-prolyl cis-trans isomerase D
MSNEKNAQPATPKKEQTSVLEKIRRRTGLLVGIVGLALIIFILESLLSSGQSIFGGDEMNSVGTINGKRIDRNDFITKVENLTNQVKQQRQSNEIDDQTRGQILETVWNQYINELVMKPELEKIGISVGESEVYDRVVVNPGSTVLQRLYDPKTNKIYEQFQDPMGNLDPNKWRQFVQNASGDMEIFVKGLEDDVKKSRTLEKYSALIRKGLYTTTAEAKSEYNLATTKLNFSYVVKTYDAVNDSVVKVTEADIQKYYNENGYLFKNTETTRKIEYVAFNVLPSTEDLQAIEKDAQRAAGEFKGKNMSEDSAFIAQESENGAITIQNFTKKSMIVRDSSIYTAAPGTVFGPYNEGAYFKIYKLEGIDKVADSARVRHILIGTVDPQTQQPKKAKAQAKREADSLLTLIKEKKLTFDTLVKTVSEDMGSRDKGGDYGWFDEEERYVDPYKYAGLMGTKGEIKVVETVYGYHIIEVLDVSTSFHTSYKVAQIFKLIAPSDETNQKTFAKANEFAGKNNTAELFDKGVEQEKLTKRVADNIKEGDRQLPAIDQAREIVRWVYTANKGDVAVFSLADKHIVAKLSSIKNKGILPLEDVKDEVAQKALLAKKAEMFTAEFNSKAANSKDINDIAAKLGLEVRVKDNISAKSHEVDGFHDDILMGTATGLKKGQMSKVTTGDMGVFVLAMKDIEQTASQADYKAMKMQLEQESAGRSDFEALNVLKELAEIEDHKSRID